MFDFDKFQINIEKIDNMKYSCTFTPIKGLNHAASMLAEKCTIEYDLDIMYIDLVNKVDIFLIDYIDDDIIQIRTVYYGIDCL